MIALLQLVAGKAHCFGGKRLALRIQRSADKARSKLRAHFRHIDIHVHDFDAGLLGFLGQRHDGGVARMAHHGDSVRLLADHVAELRDHQLEIPLGINDLHFRAGILGRLVGALVNNGIERSARRPARKHNNVLAGAPFLPGRDGGACHQGRRAGGPKQGLREFLHVFLPEMRLLPTRRCQQFSKIVFGILDHLGRETGLASTEILTMGTHVEDNASLLTQQQKTFLVIWPAGRTSLNSFVRVASSCRERHG